MPTTTEEELDQDFLRRQWVVQRIGWAIMALVILAALLGLFGTSPLATKVERVEQSGVVVEVEHPRFTRYQFMDRLHVRVTAPGQAAEEVRVAFAPAFVARTSIESAAPQPDGTVFDAQGVAYEYRVEDWSRTLVMTFTFEPRESFRVRESLSVQVGDAAPMVVPLSMWVHP